MLGSCLCQCPGTVSQSVYGCSVPQEFSVKQETIDGLMGSFLDYDFRESFWANLRYKSIVGAFWQINSFVLQFSFYKREKTTPPPPHCCPFPHNCFQQNCWTACFCSQDCLLLGVAVVPIRTSGLHALNAVWPMLVYIAVDTKQGWTPVYLLSNIDSRANDREYLGFLFNNLDTYRAYPWPLGKFISQT